MIPPRNCLYLLDLAMQVSSQIYIGFSKAYKLYFHYKYVMSAFCFFLFDNRIHIASFPVPFSLLFFTFFIFFFLFFYKHTHTREERERKLCFFFENNTRKMRTTLFVAGFGGRTRARDLAYEFER